MDFIFIKVYLPWLHFARLSTELMPKRAVSGSIYNS